MTQYDQCLLEIGDLLDSLWEDQVLNGPRFQQVKDIMIKQAKEEKLTSCPYTDPGSLRTFGVMVLIFTALYFAIFQWDMGNLMTFTMAACWIAFGAAIFWEDDRFWIAALGGLAITLGFVLAFRHLPPILVAGITTAVGVLLLVLYRVQKDKNEKLAARWREDHAALLDRYNEEFNKAVKKVYEQADREIEQIADRYYLTGKERNTAVTIGHSVSFMDRDNGSFRLTFSQQGWEMYNARLRRNQDSERVRLDALVQERLNQE